MNDLPHRLIYISNKENKVAAIEKLTAGELLESSVVTKEMNGAVYSTIALNNFLKEEYLHDKFDLTAGTNRKLVSLSEGEQKKALLRYLVAQNPDYLIVDNVFDSLDIASQQAILQQLVLLSHRFIIIQFANRQADFLPFIHQKFILKEGVLFPFSTLNEEQIQPLKQIIPSSYRPQEQLKNPLVELKNVTVSYGEKQVLNAITLEINKGEFWQLIGPNGSGKSTLLSMIIGDNVKGYGQELFLFGKKKGSGESVWDLKRHIGYFTNAMLQNFNTRDSVENMVVSGFFDSVGLYNKPTERHYLLTKEWLALIGLSDYYNRSFASLSLGYQRLVLVVRAMVKHPALLILDEPTAGLDDTDAQLFVNLVNLLAKNKSSAILYVSHKKERGLKAEFTFELTQTENGSVGKVM